MSWITSIYRTSVGKKAVMAVTGVMLFGFVLGHMAGNLKVFAGAEAFSHYAEGLRTFGEPFLPREGFLWIARVGLLVAVLAHIASAVALVRQARRARPEGYVERHRVQQSYASRTMRWGGVIILLYIVYHLMHLTFGNVHPDFIHGDAYHNLVVGLQNPLIAAVYFVANLTLGFHLYHGLWSLFQSLGLNHPRYNRWRRAFAAAFSVIVTAGFVTIPVAVQLGLVS